MTYVNRDMLILQWFLWQWPTVKNQNKKITETAYNIIRSNK